MPEPITMIGLGSGVAVLTWKLSRKYFDYAKEVFDIAAGLFALVLATPVLLFCALLIKVSSRGPVFFTQRRVGKKGRIFGMLKLRTMYHNVEARTGAVWASKNDPRVVPVCRWMRRSHIDELPQLINIIKGEMSLVGPRPERAEILQELRKVYPNVEERLTVKPGITGLAQVRNGYDTTVEAFGDKLNADLEYIEHRRWSQEFAIIGRTFAKFNDKTAC